MVYKLVFIMKMTVYTIWLVLLKGRASAISFYGWGLSRNVIGVSDRFPYKGNIPIRKTRVLTFRRESESLIVFLFKKPDFTQANYICRYLDLWLLVNRESDYSSRANSQPGITALPRITADD